MTNEQFYQSKFPEKEAFVHAAGDAFNLHCGPVGSKRCATCPFAKSNEGSLAKCFSLWLKAEYSAPSISDGVRIISERMRKLANTKLHSDGQEFYASIDRKDLLHFADELDALLRSQTL